MILKGSRILTIYLNYNFEEKKGRERESERERQRERDRERPRERDVFQSINNQIRTCKESGLHPVGEREREKKR